MTTERDHECRELPPFFIVIRPSFRCAEALLRGAAPVQNAVPPSCSVIASRNRPAECSERTTLKKLVKLSGQSTDGPILSVRPLPEGSGRRSEHGMGARNRHSTRLTGSGVAPRPRTLKAFGNDEIENSMPIGILQSC